MGWRCRTPRCGSRRARRPPARAMAGSTTTAFLSVLRGVMNSENDSIGACRRDRGRNRNHRHPGERRGPRRVGRSPGEASQCGRCKFTPSRAATAVDPGVRRDDELLGEAWSFHGQQRACAGMTGVPGSVLEEPEADLRPVVRTGAGGSQPKPCALRPPIPPIPLRFVRMPA